MSDWSPTSGSAAAIFAIASASLLPVCAQTLPTALPAGWERARDSDLGPGDDWQLRQARPTLYLRAEADFDCDGKVDRAELLVNRSANEFGLFVFKNDLRDSIMLDRGRLGELSRIGITLAQPGRVETICGKGYYADDPECKKGQPFVDVRCPSIDYFVFESASSLFHWVGGRFERFWTSD